MLKYLWYSLIAKPAMMIAPIDTPAGLDVFAAREAAMMRSEPSAAAVSSE